MSATHEDEEKHEIADKDLPAQPVLFRRRVAKDTAVCGQARFHLRALTWGELNAMQALVTREDGEPDTARLSCLLLCFGLDGVDGLLDEAGEPVEVELDEIKVLGESYAIASEAWVEKLDKELVNQLGERINELSGLARKERLRLDFTRA